MAIVGLTVSATGEALQRLAISTKVAIGEVVTQNGKTRPSKLDHFVFLRKAGESLEWKPDPDLMKHFGNECREVWIILLNDELENVFRTEYAWWTKTEKKCWGDGRAAIRRTKERPDGQEWTPCGDGCPELEGNTCKPSGDLYFVLADYPRLGSVCRLHTTSYRSVRQIYSGLEQIRTVTGGRLAGIRCKLVVRPEKATYTDGAGAKKTTTIYALNIELAAQDMQKLVGEMTQYARLFEQTKKLLGNGRKVEFVVEDEPEEERAPDVAQEFFPVEEIAPAPPTQTPGVTQPARSSEAPKEPEIWPAKDGNGNGNGHSNGNSEAVLLISQEQRKKFADLAVAHGYSPKQIKQILKEYWDVDNSSQIPAGKFEEVWKYFESDGTVKPTFQATNDDIPF